MSNTEDIKLYNGDCLEIMDKLIEQGIKVDMILTDPPYGTTACKWDSVILFDNLIGGFRNGSKAVRDKWNLKIL